RRVAVLRVDDVGDRVGNRPVVADAAGKDERHASADAFVHHTRRQHAGADRRLDAAGAIDRIDGAHVVTVPAGYRSPLLEIHAERRAEERELRVVDGERIPGQQDVHEARADQPAEVRGAAGVDENGPGDECDAAAALFRLAHHRRDARDARLDAALRRDVVGHEREVGAIAIAELRRDADAVESAHDAIARAYVAKLAARGNARLDDDRRVHAL